VWLSYERITYYRAGISIGGEHRDFIGEDYYVFSAYFIQLIIYLSVVLTCCLDYSDCVYNITRNYTLYVTKNGTGNWKHIFGNLYNNNVSWFLIAKTLEMKTLFRMVDLRQ
jgi:hypothetical protein